MIIFQCPSSGVIAARMVVKDQLASEANSVIEDNLGHYTAEEIFLVSNIKGAILYGSHSAV